MNQLSTPEGRCQIANEIRPKVQQALETFEYPNECKVSFTLPANLTQIFQITPNVIACNPTISLLESHKKDPAEIIAMAVQRSIDTLTLHLSLKCQNRKTLLASPVICIPTENDEVKLDDNGPNIGEPHLGWMVCLTVEESE